MEYAAQGPRCPWTNVHITVPILLARGQKPASLLESSVLRVSNKQAGEVMFWATPFKEREGCNVEGHCFHVEKQPHKHHRGWKHPICPHPSTVTSDTLLPSWVQLHQICCFTQHWCRRLPTSRTDPCTCSTVLQKRTAWPAQPAQPTGLMGTGVYSDSPPRFTTWDELTSGPRLGATPGCGTSVMGERVE